MNILNIFFLDYMNFDLYTPTCHYSDVLLTLFVELHDSVYKFLLFGMI